MTEGDFHALLSNAEEPVHAGMPRADMLTEPRTAPLVEVQEALGGRPGYVGGENRKRGGEQQGRAFFMGGEGHMFEGDGRVIDVGRYGGVSRAITNMP